MDSDKPIPAWAVKALYPDRVPNENEWFEMWWPEVARLLVATREAALREAAGLLSRLDDSNGGDCRCYAYAIDKLVELIDKDPAP